MGTKRKQTEVGGAAATEKEVAPSIKGDANGSSTEKTQRAASNGAKGKKERGSPEDLKQIQATFKSSMFRLQVSSFHSGVISRVALCQGIPTQLPISTIAWWSLKPIDIARATVTKDSQSVVSLLKSKNGGKNVKKCSFVGSFGFDGIFQQHIVLSITFLQIF
jgi:hypothetical protein